ncbi:enoyl-CoA hydratase [Streptomyces violarus]|uniref:2-(1,2-epoxy-1,2-dihydrophenyl)acetyl-CoA isomerase n=1 Tax=Streptomyces violarus TaxID=67380 RepID=A0A7W4ZKP0_9ACTN|nr:MULTISPECIES: enoyl-CoA hydratase-related protein [Streptomyces]MBB3074243.1 2-(1,2-epoxy-1,2-dihydrophenyl)acetyl-CoA isomerase [Streptomyces violarus]WRT96957.1 enoyl-CoA hydratase-related protein [Streptomyces sp. CGMCC 4.1772]GHC98424.1 enoyl-CoA hydratase [Streptomyces violarus]
MTAGTTSVGIEIDDGGLARVTLRRGEAGNAIDLDLARGLLEAARACTRAAVRAVLLTGEGKSFCVGGDLREFSRLSGEALEKHLMAVTDALHDALRTFAASDAPVVAAVQGAVAGAGIGLAAAADVTLAADDASFTAAYTGIGYSPDAGVSWFLPRLVGPKRALDLLLTNRRIPAAEAAAIGLVSRTVAPDRLSAEAERAAEALRRGPTTAFGATRRLVAAGLTADLGPHLDREAGALAAAAVSDTGREGVAAFLGKRAPDFTRIPPSP